MKHLQVGIIGCGFIANVHAEGWMAREDASVTAIYHPVTGRGEKLAVLTGAKQYHDLHQFFASGLDVVSICTPIDTHHYFTVMAARHGVHILCEKAIALTIEDADEMIGIARENNVQLAIALQYRNASHNRELRKLYDKHEFGSPIFAKYTDIREVRPRVAMHRISQNGGPVIDMAGHFIDVMRYITGEEAVSVYAVGTIFGADKETLAGITDLAVDAAEIIVNMNGGSTLNMHLNWGMPVGFQPIQDELFIGPNMAARYSNKKFTISRCSGIEEFDFTTDDPRGVSARINDIAESIQTGSALEVSGENGRAALLVSLAALESIKTGQVICLR
ncbi:MAG: Gfo/Idh/MocA family oxidoreductase [bacterium]